MAQVPKDDPTSVYRKRTATPGQWCKNCSHRRKPVRCYLVFGRVRRLGACNLWTLSTTT